MSNYYEYENGGQMGAPPGAPMHGGMPMQGGVPMQPGYGYGENRFFGMRGARGFGSETKPFFLTSEFVVSVLAVFAIAVTAASSTSFGGWRACVLITVIVAAYTLSRGIAKCGTRSRATDPRENVELSWRRGEHEHQHVRPAPPGQYSEAPTAQYQAAQHGEVRQYSPPPA